jgi:glycosyltransferase involved in cell wall biosynthesis
MMALDPALHLVIAGARGWRDKEIFQTVQALGLEQVVRCPGFIEEEDLPDLYRGAVFFVFPSLYEGFGLPVLEAMGCGVPVIASNISAIPEVAGKAALLIDPHNVEELAAAMGELLHNEALRERLRRQGLVQAQCFSWETTAQKTLDLYVSLAG